MENQDIRDYLRTRHIPIYQVAHKIGVSEMTMFRWLRVPLAGDHRLKVIKAIHEIMDEIEEMNRITI